MMKLLPMADLTEYYVQSGYDHPPRYCEGARKAVLIRDVPDRYGNVIPAYTKGREGLVIPVRPLTLLRIFRDNRVFHENHKLWSDIHMDNARLDRTYDFFGKRVNRKTGKTEYSNWHMFISRFDFEYID